METRNPVGGINKYYHWYSVQRDTFDNISFTTGSCVKIDVRKAFTHAFNQMTKTPEFTQFDVWKPYRKEHKTESFHSLTLYLVKCTGEASFSTKPTAQSTDSFLSICIISVKYYITMFTFYSL